MVPLGREILHLIEFWHVTELSIQSEGSSMIGALQLLGIGRFGANQHPTMRTHIGDAMDLPLDLREQHRFFQWVVNG